MRIKDDQVYCDFLALSFSSSSTTKIYSPSTVAGVVFEMQHHMLLLIYCLEGKTQHKIFLNIFEEVKIQEKP